MPRIDTTVNDKRKGQSIERFSISPINPIKDLSAMISKEVATAFFMGRPASKTKAGMIRKPPPAPTIPVASPTANPSKIIKE